MNVQVVSPSRKLGVTGLENNSKVVDPTNSFSDQSTNLSWKSWVRKGSPVRPGLKVKSFVFKPERPIVRVRTSVDPWEVGVVLDGVIVLSLKG